MAFQITYEEAKRLTLEGLNEWMKSLPAVERTKPVIIFDMKSWTIPQMISAVTMNTDIGKRYVYFYIGSLKKYVIKG